MSKIRDAAFNRDDKYFQNVIANYQKPKKIVEKHRHYRKPVSRCPKCGGMVEMPCIACEPQFYLNIHANLNGRGIIFHSFETFVKMRKKEGWTAGYYLDTLADRENNE